MTREQYRKRWIRRHGRYEKQAYKIFIKALRDMANNIPFEFLTLSNYNMIIESSVTQDDLINAYYEVYDTIGKQEGEWVGKYINCQIKDFTLSAFLSEWDKRLLSWLLENSSFRVVTVRQDYIRFLQQFFAFGINDGKTIQELARELQKAINKRNFYRWQALRIARTETTAAANYATTISSSVSGVVQEKVWISARDARTRRPPKSNFNHFAMDGVRVDENEPFNVSGEELMYPGDPRGSAGNVINCRCTHALVPKLDSTGRIIRTDRIRTV